jgi:hypothetical protein
LLAIFWNHIDCHGRSGSTRFRWCDDLLNMGEVIYIGF